MHNDGAAGRLHHPTFFCVDCDVDTYVNEQFYMLHDALWAQIASDVETMLCLECAERRLGRPLNGLDFAAVPLNEQQARLCPELAMRLRRRA